MGPISQKKPISFSATATLPVDGPKNDFLKTSSSQDSVSLGQNAPSEPLLNARRAQTLCLPAPAPQLSEEHCIPSRRSLPHATPQERALYSKQVPEWETIKVDGVDHLQRTYKVKNYQEGLAFTNRVAAMAEAENHHPKISLEWGKVSVEWWTGEIGGLHRNDFIGAAKTDKLYQSA